MLLKALGMEDMNTVFEHAVHTENKHQEVVTS